MYALTIFVSAFLLFQVQPLIARYILPWYGGSPAVWSTCMLFFQVGLLLGYAYAHALSAWCRPRIQVLIHVALLGVSLLMLPITPGEHLKPDGGGAPALGVLYLLAVTVGLPYFFVSSTGPLLQSWFGRSFPGRSPYRLYSLSNVGSLLGLLTYPFIVDPNLGAQSQTELWSVGYGLFVLCCAGSGYLLYRSCGAAVSALSDQVQQSEDEVRAEDVPAGLGRYLIWCALAACGSVLLLAGTNFICQNVAVMPFLWVLPLGLYLLSFILTFDSPRWYRRRVWVTGLLIMVPVVFFFLRSHYSYETVGFLLQLVVFLGGMFVACMVCHGELVRLKPPVRQLTGFYLLVSLGGALGGVLITFVAPVLFSDYWEYPLVFIAVLVLMSGLLLWGPGRVRLKFEWRFILSLVAGFAALLLSFGVLYFSKVFHDGVLESERNFYGVLRVVERYEGSWNHQYKMLNGSINHGIQPRDEDWMYEPASYYARHSGAGLAFRRHPRRLADESLNVGVIGLGAGALSAYQGDADRFRYYELDPDVVRLARDYFTYLDRGDERTSVVTGDARISLERELEESGSQEFDILLVDAFTGDSIPIHLLTKEAIELYFEHLAAGGILAVHISNKYFDLRPLLYGIGEQYGYEPLYVVKRRDSDRMIKRSSWVLLTQNEAFIEHPRVEAYLREWPEDIEDRALVWTDDFANVLGLLELD